ncbi:uncharacterized protein LOC144245955 isoform X1 [Lonchura striata]
MGGRRLPALAAVTVLLLVAAAASDGPPGRLEVALSGEGQSPEPPGPARLEASGESDLSTPAQLGKAVTSLAIAGSPLAPEPRDPQIGGGSSPESGSDSAAPRGAPPGPLSDGPAQSSESEEGL